MKFSYRWLADYVELPAPSAAAADELGRRLTAIGLNVESVDPMGEHGDDFVLDVEVTTNRPDCMNHLGVAREAAVALGKPLRLPAAKLREATEETERSAQVGIEAEAAAACPRYVARVVRRVRVGPSPEWLQARLRAIGQRPINNVVDVTNYVLWETGQPLHAFDLGKIARGASSLPEIHVRMATAGEILRTLDGVERKLDPSVLVIADPQRAVALGGIMGGDETKVRDDSGTVDVLIESAHFDRATVRRGARTLDMHTDASHRFERGSDPLGCAAAAARAAALIAELGGGEVLRGALDVQRTLPAPPHGQLDLARLQRFVGAEIPAGDVERILGGLGFELERQANGVWRVQVPSWRTFDFEPRPDGLAEEGDLFEEVLRQWGYDRVPPALPSFVGIDPGESPEHDLRERARDLLWAAGLAETIDFAFEENGADSRFPALVRAGAPLELANPLQETHRVMRRSLLPNLVEAALYNLRRGAPAVRLFEIAHVFPGAEDPNGEFDAVAVVLGGTLGTPWERGRELDFFDLKGVVEGLAAGLGSALDARTAELPGFGPDAAELWRDAPREERVGYLGRLAVVDSPLPLLAAELRLGAIAGPLESSSVEAPSRFPGVAADLTLTHPLSVPWGDLAAAIAARRVPDLRRFGLKDRYRGAGVPAGAVKTTIHFLYNAEDRSLTQEEVNERHQALAAALAERFGWREGR